MLSDLESLNRHIKEWQRRENEALEAIEKAIALNMVERVILARQRSLSKIRSELADFIERRDNIIKEQIGN